MQPISTTCVVITDTSLLINLTYTGHLSLLCQTPPYRFVVPDEVVKEVTDAIQRQALEAALDAGVLAKVTIETTQELELYDELLRTLGSGESACLPWHRPAAGLLRAMRGACFFAKPEGSSAKAVY